MSYNQIQAPQELLNTDQALIPQSYKKSLQSKVLMGHYQQNELKRMYDRREKMVNMNRQFQFTQLQNQRHLYELQMKRQLKQNTKNHYSKIYDEMITQKKQRQNQEKQRQKWLERKLLNENSWLKDTYEQKQIEKHKKIQYAKELEKSLKMQEDKRVEEAVRIKEYREKGKKDSEEVMMKSQIETKRNGNQPKGNRSQRVKNMLIWDSCLVEQENAKMNQPMTPRMERMLKVHKQRYYDNGTQMQLKSEHQKTYFDAVNPEKISSTISHQKAQAYNPITNPIPYQYRNPNVLKLMAKYN